MLKKMSGDELNPLPNHRSSLKPQISSDNYPKWRHKLRENCFKRVRADRSRLLWKLRLTKAEDQSSNHKSLVKSTLQNIVSDELRKIKESSSDDNFGAPTVSSPDEDMIWEYDALQAAYQGGYEEMLLEMQRIFYEDMRMEENRKDEEGFIRLYEEEEDEYLAHAVYEHMQLSGEQVEEEVWCPICKREKLHENSDHIYCNRCGLKLNTGDEVNLKFLRVRLGEAHAEHLDRGCRLRPEFCLENKFELTALYIKCGGCNTFEVVL